LGEALFERILQGRRGVLLSTHLWEDTWRFLRHKDGKIHLEIPELLHKAKQLDGGAELARDASFPLVLIAGERRSYTANTIFREPSWRRNDQDGALRIHPQDASTLGLNDGDLALCESPRGALTVRIKVCDTVRPGMVTMPNGYGTRAPAGEVNGPNLNLLTSASDCDDIAATPYHKHVRVRLVALGRQDGEAVANG
jgi:anaerobic selenocysteine-containing dehydrogenase